MEPLGDSEIRASFVNCSKGEARRMSLPRELDGLPWADLDFLGWRDPGAPDRGYLVTERAGELVGVTLRVPQGGPRALTKTTMCSLCLTAHGGSGVSLLAARKVGASGRDGNTVGAYMCADLACSLYVRGKKTPLMSMRYKESLSVEERLDRLRGNLDEFVDKVLREG
ncbi:FBP domain-containing protein [Streptomyces luteoverticillatus]|uniref:FBP domain-containing protein n=1 Tax=Streptomyces luteoverticillatus TaxID=66425 RepID=A0A3Q9FVZ4_STRLT|nr:FBP domain-containing protein [Streptomyces luteoverticillatus]AZQ71624.1 FBP domain-containing protein [Streptomyces luteoverticillatus]